MAENNRIISYTELMKHNDKNEPWLIIEGKIYDVSNFNHPGGNELIERYAGKDATESFGQKKVRHSQYAKSLLNKKFIGILENKEPPKQYQLWIKEFMKKNKEYYWKEISQHSQKGNYWIVLNKTIYNISDFISKHPGGKDVLLQLVGKNGQEKFVEAGHSNDKYEKLEKYKVGYVVPGDYYTEININKKSRNLVIAQMCYILFIVLFLSFIMYKLFI